MNFSSAHPQAPYEDVSDAHTSIFDQSWWLDAATDNTWAQTEVSWDGKLVGSLRYWVRKRYGLTYIRMPPYTRTLAPRFNLPAVKPVKYLDSQIRVLKELLSQLPRHDRFEMTLSPHCDAMFPFVQIGYTAAATYTFCATNDNPTDVIWSNMDQKTRNVVKTASKRFNVEFHNDIDRFIDLSKAQHSQNTKEDKNDYPALKRLWAACHNRGQITVLSIRGEDGFDAASSLLVQDRSYMYFLASARNPQISGNGANSLQIWKALNYAHDRGLSFDIDGYESSNSAKFLRSFGLSPVVRPVISKTSPLFKAALVARSLLFPRDDLHYRLAEG
jgi:hypothetical protein